MKTRVLNSNPGSGVGDTAGWAASKEGMKPISRINLQTMTLPAQRVRERRFAGFTTRSLIQLVTRPKTTDPGRESRTQPSRRAQLRLRARLTVQWVLVCHFPSQSVPFDPALSRQITPCATWGSAHSSDRQGSRRQYTIR